jgi:hypothetical protein
MGASGLQEASSRKAASRDAGAVFIL